MAILEIEIPDSEIIRVAKAQGYGIDGKIEEISQPLTKAGAETFLVRKIRKLFFSGLKSTETRAAIKAAKQAVEDALDQEDVVKVRKAN